MVERTIEFAADLFGLIRVSGKDDGEQAAFSDRADDGRGPIAPGGDVSRLEPASDSMLFQRSANRRRNRLVFLRMSDEDVRHGPPPLPVGDGRILAPLEARGQVAVASRELFAVMSSPQT